MSVALRGLVERLRQPEYVGENRCTPCTALNLVLAGLGSGAVATVVSPAVGAASFGLAVLAIYLRGYLVPGTPTITERYFPDRLLAAFDKLEDVPEPADGERSPEAVLSDAGVVEPCEAVEDLCLVDSFRSEWYAAMAAIDGDDTERRDLGAVLDVDPEALAFEDHDGALVARYDGRRLGQWESRAALQADLAGANVLADRYDGWTTLSVPNRSRVLSGLRVFLDACPSCGGEVAMDQDTVRSCCRTVDVVAVRCGDCGSRLLEVEHAE